MSNKSNPSKKWKSDAIDIDIDQMENLVYTNQKIRTFLESDQWLFLSANKGMGKTLLMMYKRSIISRRNSSALLLPKQKPFLDNMNLVVDVNRKMSNYMAEQKEATRMWIFSFAISILSHLELEYSETDKESLEGLPNYFSKYLFEENKEINASDIFRYLMLESPNELNKILSSVYELERLLRTVKRDVRMFMDRVDQALKKVGQKAWVAVQCALIEAAWVIYNSNNHIKIYATIRQEAISIYSSDTMANIQGSLFVLRYERDELIMILDTLARVYEGKDSFEDFIGVNTVIGDDGEEEKVADFIIRHTLQRPRDLVRICSEISLDEPVDNNHLVETIYQVSSRIIPYILDESEVFLDSILDQENRKTFVRLLTANILKFEDILDHYANYNSLDKHVMGHMGIEDKTLSHPFSELYKVGLLGVITEKGIQKFRLPYDLQDFQTIKLPESEYYILHPALINPETKTREHKYETYRHIITGHNVGWKKELNEYLISIQKLLFRLEYPEFRFQVLETLKKNISSIKRNTRLPNNVELDSILEKLEKLIEDERDDDKLEYAVALFEILNESKNQKRDDEPIFLAEGSWKMIETYNNGRTNGELTLLQNETKLEGKITICDISDEFGRFCIEEMVNGEIHGEKIMLQGTDYKLTEGKIDDYALDTWVGEFHNTDTIVGTSTDRQGSMGTFLLLRSDLEHLEE